MDRVLGSGIDEDVVADQFHMPGSIRKVDKRIRLIGFPQANSDFVSDHGNFRMTTRKPELAELTLIAARVRVPE